MTIEEIKKEREKINQMRYPHGGIGEDSDEINIIELRLFRRVLNEISDDNFRPLTVEMCRAFTKAALGIN